jgi:hypothetical protein
LLKQNSVNHIPTRREHGGPYDTGLTGASNQHLHI